MRTEEFLRRVVGDTGRYCVFAANKKTGRKVQNFYGSTTEVIAATQKLNDAGYDTFFALATFGEDRDERKADNAVELRAFFMDLDCGDTKEFNTPEQAVLELRAFCKKNSLPRPALVSSGRGIHVYWSLTTPVAAEHWLPVAYRLKALCTAEGFGADPAVTSDSARVLRLPETNNYKQDPPLPVAILGTEFPDPVDFEEFAALLPETSKPVFGALSSSAAAIIGNSAVMDKLIGSSSSSFKQILEKTRDGKGCEQLAHLIANQEEIDEPLWRAGLSIANVCDDGDKAAAFISRNHSEYDHELTMRKMQATKGPYLCSRFNEYNPGVCENCPNWGEIKSPIVLGNHVVEATEEDNVVQAPIANKGDADLQTYVIPPYPKPYFRGVKGGVYMRSRNDDGDIDERMVYHNDIYAVRRLRDAEAGEAIVMRLHLPKDGVREFTMPLTAASSRDEFRKMMSMHGVIGTNMEELMRYTSTWVTDLQEKTAADDAHRQFGWTDKEGTSFVLGNQEVFADRIDFNPPAAPTVGLFPAFEPRGTLEGWKENMDFYNRPNFEVHQYVVGMAFGSPLMAMFPMHASAMHIYSKDSGFGKTTAMRAGLTIWGDPELLMLTERDTLNTRLNRAEAYQSLPLFMDELTQTPGNALSDLAYQVFAGKQRGRMTSGANIERHRGDPWKLNVITSGNTSFIERVMAYKAAPKAEIQRFLEVNVQGQHHLTKQETDDFAALVGEHYGYAGIIFIQYVMANYEAVKRLVMQVQARIDAEAGLTAENRFWSAGAAVTIASTIIAKKLGLINYDVENLFSWIVRLLRNRRVMSFDVTTTSENAINEYIAEHWSHVLSIKSTDDLRGGGSDPLLDVSLIVPAEAMPKGRFVARYETDTQKLYLIPKPLREWCERQQINYASLVSDMKQNMKGKRAKMRITKGTHMRMPPTDVLIVSFDAQSHVDESEKEIGDAHGATAQADASVGALDIGSADIEGWADEQLRAKG